MDSEAESIFRAGGTDGQRLSLGRRRFMALMEIIRRNHDPAHADTQVPPTVMVTITLDELLKQSGHGDLIGTREHVSSETVRRLCCDANIIRIVTDGDSEILDLGRTVRTAPPKYRRALAARDRGCVFPGCDRPPGHCRAHHIRWWDRDHGETSLQNLALLCHHHHHLVHEGGWKLTRAPDGQLQFTDPTAPPSSSEVLRWRAQGTKRRNRVTRCNRGCVVRRAGLGVVAAVTAVLVLAGPVGASIAHSRLVSPTPAAFTPKVVLGTSGQTVYALAQVGTTMFAGGKFTQIRDANGTTTYSRANFAAFGATTGAVLPLSLPTDGAVQVIVPSPDGRAIYIGGDFRSIGGIAARGIVRFDLTTNALDRAFLPGLDGGVTDAAFVGSRLIIAGTFTRHLRAINPASGVDTGYINLKLEGKVDPNDAIRVRRFAANPAGTHWWRSATSHRRRAAAHPGVPGRSDTDLQGRR